MQLFLASHQIETSNASSRHHYSITSVLAEALDKTFHFDLHESVRDFSRFQ